MILLALILAFISIEVYADIEDIPIICDLSSEEKLAKFRDWKGRGNRTYKDPTEEKTRSDRWRRFSCVVDYLNDQARSKGGALFGHNHMSDWSPEEYKNLLGAKIVPEDQKRDIEEEQQSTGNNAPLPHPASADWCAKGYCTPVKDQKQCGSCWAYSSTAAYESIWAIKNGITNCATNSACLFSPQYVLDCNYVGSTVRACTNNCGKSNGCDGGYVAFDYIANKGHFSLADYPIASDSMRKDCTKVSSVSASNSASTWVSTSRSITEDQIAANIAAYGPGVVLINADNWQGYSSGVMTKTQCDSSNTGVNHAVVIVGYGTDTSGKNYWLIRNSWGPYWGEKGFIRMERGTGACNLSGYQFLKSDWIVSGTVAPAPSTPVATPIASPVATPIASPVATPVATPIASPIAAPSSSCIQTGCLPFPQNVGKYTLNKCTNIPEYNMTGGTYGSCIKSKTGTSFVYMACPKKCGSTPDCFGAGCPVKSQAGYAGYIAESATTELGTGSTITNNGSSLPVYIGAVVAVVVCIVVVIAIVVIVRRRADQEEIV